MTPIRGNKLSFPDQREERLARQRARQRAYTKRYPNRVKESRARNRKRYPNGSKVAVAKWRKAHPVEYARIKKNTQQAYLKRYPDRRPCHSWVAHARKRLNLKFERCYWPGCTVTVGIEAHHSDYSRPTEIIPLCGPHHREWHRVKGALPFDLSTIKIKGCSEHIGQKVIVS